MSHTMEVGFLFPRIFETKVYLEMAATGRFRLVSNFEKAIGKGAQNSKSMNP